MIGPITRPVRQARAIKVRGKGRSRRRFGLRAPFGAIALSALVLLAPDLTLAPLSAVEPLAESSGGVGADAREPRVPGPIRPLDGEDRRAFVGVVPDVPTAPQTVVPAPTVALDNPDAARFGAALEAARSIGGAYGVTFAAVRDGELLWSGATGRYRDGATSLGADDSLVIGSVTKTFVAATVLQLVEEGRLDLDDAVLDHLPGERSVTRDITIRQLLDHTSGLADVFNDKTRVGIETEPREAWDRRELFATLHAPWYAPGEGYAYANTNYYLLGLIVERLTGASLADELDRRFFTPLGLPTAHVVSPDDGASAPLEPAWASIFWASGAMTASAADLARWGDALYGDVLLDAESRREMMRLNREDYGLGVQRIEVPGATGHGHTGMLKTYTSLLLHLPDEDVTLALLVNRTHVDLGGMLAARPGDGPSLLELVGVDLPSPDPSPAPSVTP